VKKKIVFVNQSTGYLTIDVINAFAEHYDEVALIYGNIRIQDVEINQKVKKSRIVEKSRVSHIRRFIAWFFASIQTFFLLLLKYRNYEIFYVSLPPFAYFSSLLLKNKFSLLVYDLYPDVLKIIGISENNIIYRLWAMINKLLYKKAHRIYTISDSMALKMSQYVPIEKIHPIPLWAGLTNVTPISKSENPFVIKYNLQNKFVVQYSGNIGGGTSIELLLDVAKKLIKEEDIIFLIIGRGQKMPLVEKIVKEEELINCLILPFQPDEVVRFSLASADVSVVLVEENTADSSIPSKIYNIMAVGSFILSVSPNDSEVSKLVNRYKIGANFNNNQEDLISDYILNLKKNPDELFHFKKRSIDASFNFTPENAKKYVDIYLTNQNSLP
jgi:hypothetical protein